MTIADGPFKGIEKNSVKLLLADPPWEFMTYSGGAVPQRAPEQHYPVMSLDELKALPVADLMAKDSGLVMWFIDSHLDQALALGRHWGFTFKTILFVWVKVGKKDPNVRPITMGHWSRKQTEIALLFTRGKPKRLDAGVRQLIETDDHVIHAPRREHSRKPDEQFERIERLVAGPYAELFARKHRPGWVVWGNETSKFDPIVFDDLLGDSTTGFQVNRFEDLLG